MTPRSSVTKGDRQCTCGSWWQLRDNSFEADAGDVPQLLLVRQHVGAERVHDGLHLVLLHLPNQRAQAAGGEASQDEGLIQLSIPSNHHTAPS